ncbi:Gfo/Idh/MocA family protein [Microseira wollei]|uniref:Oxidoreductase domain-containing protein n=1 Tax=Microseira wollei NIES-4236 TaxID=2530354 RepID=A0AAV3X8R7_9CYAN|nr:Gfo/Idh/MocA family oxidoreductase [Microseira wollei]GET35757.1 oxidoreductase domain-containing protein [Microseira wollei NIES-4236]
MEPKINFGLVGAGSIAQAYVQAFGTCKNAQLVAVADIRLDAAKTLAAKLGCQSYDSYQAMAESEKLDAVIICTPPITHPEISLYFIDRKIHVLCEKPFSIDSKSAKTMLDSAKKAGVKLTMASKFRYVEDVIKARNIVNSGILGEIVLFENAFTARVDMTCRWNSNPKVSGGGVLIDNGTHSVDIMRYFLGPLAEVQVVEGKRIQGLIVEDTVRIFVTSTSGVTGNIDLSWSINKDLDYYIRIYGSLGTISIGWKESKYRQSTSSDWIVFGKGYDKVQAFGSQIENFAKAIQGEESLLITSQDALASVEVIEAAYAAMNQNHWMAVAQETNASQRLNGLKQLLELSKV